LFVTEEGFLACVRQAQTVGASILVWALDRPPSDIAEMQPPRVAGIRQNST